MTGYGRGEADHEGAKFSVELNTVNRKQSDIVVNLPRDLTELEPRIRQTINENISRGRTNVLVTCTTAATAHASSRSIPNWRAPTTSAMRALQKELSAPGEITIGDNLAGSGRDARARRKRSSRGGLAGQSNELCARALAS